MYDQQNALPQNFEGPSSSRGENGTPKSNGLTKKKDNQKKEKVEWFKLFAELDPLANPDAMPGGNVNQSHAA